MKGKVYNYTYGVAICLCDHTWVEKETIIRIRSAKPIGLALEGWMIWQAKEDFAKLYHEKGTAIGITWSADFITSAWKDRARHKPIIDLEDL